MAIVFFTLMSPFYVIAFILNLIIFLLELPIGLLGLLTFNETVKGYNRNLLMSVDQTFNSFMAGDEDETMSSRAGRVWYNTWWCKFIDFIIFWEPRHCETHIEPDVGKDDLIFPVKGAKH